MVWPHHQGYISSKNMGGTGIWRCKGCLLLLVSTKHYMYSKCESALLRQPEKSITPPKKKLALQWGWIPDTTNYRVTIQRKKEEKKEKKRKGFIRTLTTTCATSQPTLQNLLSRPVSNDIEWNEMDPSTHFTLQTSKGRSFQLASCQTPAFRSARPPNEWNGWPNSKSTSFWVQTCEQRGNIKRSAFGGVLSKERH